VLPRSKNKATGSIANFASYLEDRRCKTAKKEAHNERSGEKEDCGCAKGEMGEGEAR